MNVQLGFFIGLLNLLALSVGLRISPIVNARLSIDQSLLTRVTNKEVLDELVARQSLTWKTWVPSYAGVASFFCLIVGMLAIASRL